MAMTRDQRAQIDACLFMFGLGFGLYRWATMTVLEEQTNWLRAWRPTGLGH
jgi:hypothetical protein